MKTKLDLAKERKARREREHQEINALIAELRRFNELLNDRKEIDLSEFTKQLTTLPKLMTEPLNTKLAGFLDDLTRLFMQQKQKQPDLAKLIKQIKIEQPELDLEPLAKEVAKLKTKTQQQSQQPEDFAPYRRVVKLGNRFIFDDNMTGNNGGGGGIPTELTRNDNSIAVVNPDGSNITDSPTLTKRYDIDGSIIFTAKAPLGTAEGDSNWTITKYDFSDAPNSYGKVAINASWSARDAEVYV